MDLFLTEEDYLPAEFDELPLDEAILRVREIEDERPTKKKSKGKVKRKRNSDDEDDLEKQDDEYVEDDGWLVNDLGEDGYVDEDEEDEDDYGDEDGADKKAKVYASDEAEEVDDSGKSEKPKDDKKDEKEKKRRRRILGPQVKLNADRLKHINALPALPGILKSLKFKGKGYEEEDLDLILQTMEHWAHRVMPKMKFDDFIERAEQLGSKKLVKTFVTKMRYNMVLDTRGDIPGRDFDRDTDDDEMLFNEDLPPAPKVNAEDAFDALMKEAEMVVKQRAAEAASVSNINTSGSSAGPSNTIPPITASPVANYTLSSSSSQSQNKPSTLTEEQRKKIAENARKAAEKRLSIALARKAELEKSLTD